MFKDYYTITLLTLTNMDTLSSLVHVHMKIQHTYSVTSETCEPTTLTTWASIWLTATCHKWGHDLRPPLPSYVDQQQVSMDQVCPPTCIQVLCVLFMVLPWLPDLTVDFGCLLWPFPQLWPVKWLPGKADQLSWRHTSTIVFPSCSAAVYTH